MLLVNFPQSIPLWLKRWGPALLMMSVIFLASSLPSDRVPDLGKIDFTIKKLGHVLGYALLALAYRRGFEQRGASAARACLLAEVCAILYSVTDEFHQSFVPGRGATVFDVGVDAAGAGLGLTLQTLARTLRSRSTHSLIRSQYRKTGSPGGQRSDGA